MKKIIVFLLTAVLCLSTMAIGMAAEGETDLYAKIYRIEKYTPTIDGELDPEYLLSEEVKLRDNGPEFATGSIYYLWDDEALYFHVTINDTTPSDPKKGIDHETDCIELLFSLYNFDITATNITAKQANDIGDSQFRVFRTKQISKCNTIVDNGITYMDGSHGGFGQWVYNNTNWEEPEKGSNYIIHWDDDAIGYGFEGFVKWSPELLTDAEHPLGEDSIIGLGIQVNDDNNFDNKREKKCYNENAAPNDWSMSTNRATCGKFQLQNNGFYVDKEPLPSNPSDPGTSDPSVIFALFTVISAGGFTLFATKKAKND